MKKWLFRFRYFLSHRQEMSLLAVYALIIFGIPPIGGGRGGSKKKEEARADDMARQERERAEREAADLRARQEAEASVLRSRQEEIANQLLQQYQQSVTPTVLEAARTGRVAELEPELMGLLRTLQQQEIAPVRMTGPIGEALQSRLLSDLATPRQIPYEETFSPAFTLLREQVAQQAAQRGLTGSGLELENLGRAGIDLAIKQAQERQNNRLLNEQLRQQALANAFSGQTQAFAERAGEEAVGAQRRGEMETFLANLQALEDVRRAREQAGLQTGAAQSAQLRQTGNLGGAEMVQTGTLQGSNIIRGGQQNALNIESAILQNQIAQRQAADAALGQMISTIGSPVIGAAVGGATGGWKGAGQGALGGLAGGVSNAQALLGIPSGGGVTPMSNTIPIWITGTPPINPYGSASVPTGSQMRAARQTRGTGFDPYGSGDFLKNFPF